jgi:hypothetical protein
MTVTQLPQGYTPTCQQCGHWFLVAKELERSRDDLAALLHEYIAPRSEMWKWVTHADWILRVEAALKALTHD